MFESETLDVAVSVDFACNKAAGAFTARPICNSQSRVNGGAVGGSLLFADAYLHASACIYRGNYGTAAADGTINMKSDCCALEGEARNLADFIQYIKGQCSKTDCAHTEFDDATRETVFTTSGSDLRLEVRHARRG